MVTQDKWLSVIKDIARSKNISLSSFSETRIKQALGDVNAVVAELNSRSGHELSGEEQRAIKEEIERKIR